MRPVLRTWIADADTERNIEAFELPRTLDRLRYLDGRATDLYFSLVGELFDALRVPPADDTDWATLGNALARASEHFGGMTRSDAWLFAGAAFYSGGYAASAYLSAREADPSVWDDDTYRACYELMARPSQFRSERVSQLIAGLRAGRSDALNRELELIGAEEARAMALGPDQWVAERIFRALLERFAETNVRAVLPEATDGRWDPLVESLLDRSPPVWDFFPSQVDAIRRGLLTSEETYSLQMPTGAGKTALTETLIFSQLLGDLDGVAVLLVPYRALARELRSTLARRLDTAGLPTRTVYGGTVPTREESQALEDVRVIVATPEAFTGLVSRVPELRPRLRLVVVDEGHLLDQPGRGIGLELLLARLRGQAEVARPRVVFLSAIVPNIEEINTWLGGSSSTVVRSTFQPAEVEYGVLRVAGRGRGRTVDLEMQARSASQEAHTIPSFLTLTDFVFSNPQTGRTNTHNYNSVKTLAVAAARKAMAIGSVAVFAARKTGSQGVGSLAEELLEQIDKGLSPKPRDHISPDSEVDAVVDYLETEYGSDWVGTRALRSGAIVHHGDVPQETREALEELLTDGHVPMVMCTSTLAEGVNLPIRTLVLYGVRRGSGERGRSEPMLARDIKNLVGRAGRAGRSTKGLVICANEKEWADIAPVAHGRPGEDVSGALFTLLERLRTALALRGLDLSNAALENSPGLYALVDGLDAALLELFTEEVSTEQLEEIASQLGDSTFASSQMSPADRPLLRQLFALRARRLAGFRDEGVLEWARETGARPRLLDSVVNDLAPRTDWSNIAFPLDDELLKAMVSWAFSQRDFVRDLETAYRPGEPPSELAVRTLLRGWIEGRSFERLADDAGLSVDRLLAIHGRVIGHALVTLVEQGVALLEYSVGAAEQQLPEAVRRFPEYLRYGVATPAARALMAQGVRHRRAAVELGSAEEMAAAQDLDSDPFAIAVALIEDQERWQPLLGNLVYQRTRHDLR
jgi:helicase